MASAYSPNFKLVLNGRDATKDLSPYLLSLVYTDNLTGKADELRGEFDNSDFRFLNAWYFSPGMMVEAWIEDLYCGKFQIDDSTQSSPPHVAEFRAQSAEFSGPIRTKNSFAHFKKSLAAIVGQYANTYKFRLVGKIPDITITTLIQSRESDINFLHRIAKDYGCICSLKGGTLVFDAIENIWARKASKTLHFVDMKSYHFNTSLPDSLDIGVSLYNDPFDEKVNGQIITGQPGEYDPSYLEKYNGLTSAAYDNNIYNQPGYGKFSPDYDIKNNVVNVIHKKAESDAEAKRIALGDFITKKNKKHTCSVTVPGDQYLVAGNGINIQDAGKRSGYWLIEASKHSITKHGGYITEIDLTHGAASTGEIVPPPDVITPEINSGTTMATRNGSGIKTQPGNINGRNQF